MKALNVLALFAFLSVQLLAQPDYRQPGDPARVTYEAFRVDQLARQADVSPTGDVAFSIPILVVPNRLGHDWQLRLDYHSAVSQRQRASWVGLGWDLELGHMERTIMGRSDDQIRGLPNGELGANTGQHTERSEGWGRLWDNHNRNASFASADSFDQADVYRLSVEGSGTEILPFPSLRPSLCSDSIKVNPESFLPIQYKPWSIQALGWPNSNDQMATFWLRKEDGTQYYFGNYDGAEGVDSITVCTILGQTPAQSFRYPYRWNLVKIRYPDGVTATVDYYFQNRSSQNPYIHSTDQVQIDRYDEVEFQGNLFGLRDTLGVYHNGKVQYGYSRPCTLKTETHCAVFYASNTADSSTDRNSRLDSVVLLDRKSNSRLKTVVFMYATGNHTQDHAWQEDEKLNDNQLTLIGVKMVGSDGTQLPPYEFEYLENPLTSAYYLSLYSYSNPQFPGHFSDADGDSTANAFAKAWKLKRMTLPTGGTIDYTYERISDVAYDPEGAPWPVYSGSRHWGYKMEPRGRVKTKTVTNDLGEVRTWSYSYGPALFDWPSRVSSATYIPRAYRSTLLNDTSYQNYYQIFRGCPVVHRWVTITSPDSSSRRVHFTSGYCAGDADPLEKHPDLVVKAYSSAQHITVDTSRAGRRGLIWKEVYNGIDSTIYHYAFSEEGGMQDRYEYYRYYGPGNRGHYVYNTSIWAYQDSVTVVRDGVTSKTAMWYTHTPRMTPHGGGGIRTLQEIGNRFNKATDYIYASEVYSDMDTKGMFSQLYRVKITRSAQPDEWIEKNQWTKWKHLQTPDVYVPASEWLSPSGNDSIQVLDYTTYDSYANITASTDANGLTTTYTYGSYDTPSGPQVYENAFIRKIEHSINSVTLSRNFEYTALGLVSKITDENTRVTQFQYDGLGRPITVVGPDGITTNEYAYYVNSEDGNYITAKDYRYPGLYRQTNYYADNLGQTYQTQISLGSQTLVSHIVYDQLWRVLNDYKPFFNNGSLARDDQAHAHDSTYYAGLGIEVGNRPFTSNVYDKSGRILEQHAPGPVFDTSFVKTRYAANVESDSAGYPVGTLFRTTSYDENKGANNQVNQDFRDVLGNVVLTRTDSAGLRLTTRFERDASGRVLSVVRPDRSAKLTYAYDSRGLLKDKSTPEQGTTQYLYDRMGNLRFTKDANHTASAGNSVNISVQFYGGRTDSGEFVLNMPGRVQTSMHNLDYDVGATLTLFLKATNGTQIGQFSCNTTYYRSDVAYLPKGTYKYLVQGEGGSEFEYTIQCQNFLDFTYQKYDSLGRMVERGELEASSFGAFTQANANTPSYPTSSRVVERTNVYDTASTDAAVSGLQHNLLGRLSYTVVYRLGEPVMTSFFSYDTYGRLEWIVRTGSVLGSYPKRIYYSYDMQGNILKKSYVDDYSSANNFSVWCEYDEAGRLARLFAGTDSVSRVNEAEYVYHANGAVDTLRLGTAQTVDYSYNERDWLTDISSTKFQEKLGYNILSEIGAAQQPTRQYNGNISWLSHYINGLYYTPGSPILTASWVGYTFGYDHANRLSSADFGAKRNSGGVWYTTSAFDMPIVSYDPDGNLDSLARKSSGGQEMDKLKYHYPFQGQVYTEIMVPDATDFEDDGWCPSSDIHEPLEADDSDWGYIDNNSYSPSTAKAWRVSLEDPFRKPNTTDSVTVYVKTSVSIALGDEKLISGIRKISPLKPPPGDSVSVDVTIKLQEKVGDDEFVDRGSWTSTIWSTWGPVILTGKVGAGTITNSDELYIRYGVTGWSSKVATVWVSYARADADVATMSSALSSVSDGASSSVSSTDIDNQTTNNYAYDGNGNVVQDLEKGIGFVIYDINNLPVSMHRTSGSSIYYTYDQAGQRVKKADGTTTTQYLHGADGQPFAILDPAYQTKPTYYLHGLDLVGQVNRDGSSLTRYYYLKDHLGSIRVRVNASGTVMAYDDFYPYGQIMDGRSSNSGMPETRFKYTGKERDVESQYDYFGARYYDARIGRWLALDPLAEKYPSFSPYVYVAANPIRLLDCDGKVIVDKKGAPVHISLGHDGELTFSMNADQSTRRIANALALSSAGTEALVEMVDSPTKVHLNLSEASNLHLLPMGRYETVFGHTLQGSLDADDFGVFQNKDGTYGIKEATITVFEGSLKQGIEKGSGSKYEGLTLEQAIGAAAGHESVHAVNKKEVNADKLYERTHLGQQRPEREREQEPNRIQRNIIDEYKKKDQR